MSGDMPDDHGKPLRAEVYPPHPDIYGEEDGLDPHPDGRPWAKACKMCYFRAHDPQDVGDRARQTVLATEPEDAGVFYCIHRADGENIRICACYAAHRAGQGSGMRDARAAFARERLRWHEERGWPTPSPQTGEGQP